MKKTLRKAVMRYPNERGIAMVTTLLVLMLISALLIGFTTVVMSDQRYRFIDRDRGQAFYGAAGGIEKLTADLGNLFYSYVAPTGAQISNLVATANVPVLSRVVFAASSAPQPMAASNITPIRCVAPNVPTTLGTNGYTIMFCGNAAGNPTTISPPTVIATGPYQGLIAEQTPYQLDVTAKTTTGGEVHLVRQIEAVAIPVFQFGMFSDVDLSFSAADDFSFGGRVHTNGNLFLAETACCTLTLSDKVTAVKEIVRQTLSNGVSIDTVSQTGIVKMASSSTTFANLLRTQGSVVGDENSAANEPAWHTTSLTTYNSWIRNGRTGAKRLDLPLIMPSVGGSNPDIVRRPTSTESTTSILYNERLFSKASIRILLSDTAADISGLPGVSATPPVSLETNWNTAPPAGYGPVDLTHPPVALSPGFASTAVTGVAGTTITFTAAGAALFRPTFTQAGNAATITCTTKTATQLTGCVGVTVSALPTTITANSFAGGATGPSVATLTSTATTMTFAGTNVNVFNALPMWNATTNTLITCQGTFTSTSFSGCNPMPANGNTIVSGALSNAGTSTLGGFLKIEIANAAGSWTDVTTQILNYGFGDASDSNPICADPTPNAIIRLQRLRDTTPVVAGPAGGGCNFSTVATGIKDPTNWWPMALFDTREALNRDINYPVPANGLPLGGVVYYVALDVANLGKWFKGLAPYAAGTGNTARIDNTGYTVYFSDRRNNRNASNAETGEYGYEDFVNPGVANGPPNGSLDAGEDLNGNGVLDLYGGHPNYQGVYDQVPPCTAAGCPGAAAANTLNLASRPTTVIGKSLAQMNRPILFRRALKLMNGGAITPNLNGLTIASENPVYVKGDWNVPAGTSVATFDTGVFAHAATSVIADAVTLLSNNWTDGNSMDFPYAVDSRPRPADSFYRLAIVSGKNRIFPKPGDLGASSTFGTDGGAHSFLRMLEGGAASPNVHYRGSMATFFYSRQAVGPFKCCNGLVYGVPTRDYMFDTDFLNPALLPPNTPVFRDMNAIGFSQELRPGK